MVDRYLYDYDKLKELSKKYTPAQISHILKQDPRVIHRLLRDAKLLDTNEPTESICLMIKDTPKGRKLAKALRLEVGVVYPRNCNKDVHKRSDNCSPHEGQD